jgi:hypothetical protein
MKPESALTRAGRPEQAQLSAEPAVARLLEALDGHEQRFTSWSGHDRSDPTSTIAIDDQLCDGDRSPTAQDEVLPPDDRRCGEFDVIVQLICVDGVHRQRNRGIELPEASRNALGSQPWPFLGGRGRRGSQRTLDGTTRVSGRIRQPNSHAQAPTGFVQNVSVHVPSVTCP